MASNPKVFIILTPGFPSSEDDSTCLPMQQQFIRTLIRTNPLLRVVVLTFQYPYHNKTYQWNGAEVICFGGKNRGGLSRLWLRKKVETVLKNIHGKNEIIGMLSFWYGECAVVGKSFARAHSVRHFCWVLGQDARKQNKYLQRFRPCSKELIALSHFLQNEMEKSCGVRPAFVVPPGVETELFSSKESLKDIDLLAVGSLLPLKQYDIFLKLVFEIKKTITSINAVLVGDGPEMIALQKKVQALGLGKEVIITGALPYNDVLELMQRAKVFLHPSSYEGFPGVCLEAVSAGAEVVSFCKPMQDDFPHWQIATSEKDMLRKALFHLQYNQEVRQPEIIFSMKDTVDKMMGLYHQEIILK